MKLGPRPTGPLWTPAEDEQLLALLDSGMDKKLIARRLKRTVQAVLTRKYVLNKRRLVELGLKAKGK
jgi:DNA-binding NarL/FixJ family response regulator